MSVLEPLSRLSSPLFSSQGFMPHGHCYLWRPALVWLHVLSDGAIAAAYLTIPLTLGYFLRRRDDLPFSAVFWAFAAFIVSCGMTHVLEIYTLWNATYWLSGVVKAFTAVASLATAVMLVRLVPLALAMPGPGAQRAMLEMRERLASIVESTNDAIIGKTPGGVIETWNAGAERLYGYPAGEVVGRPSSILVPSELAAEHDSVIQRVGRGERVEAFETVRLNRGGERLEVSLSASPIHNAAGGTVGISTITRDISQRKRNERLQLAEVLLREVHHRVKNNLQVITSLLKLHAEQMVDPAAQAAFRDSQDRVRSIALLHERLHKAEALGSVEIQGYAEELIQALLRASGRQPVAVKIEAQRIELPMDAAVPLGLILSELVSNALRHAFDDPPRRPPELQVSLRPGGPGELRLEVGDNGRGLPPPEVLTASRSLGMHIVRVLSRQLDGRLELCNDGGAICRLTFPRPAVP